MIEKEGEEETRTAAIKHNRATVEANRLFFEKRKNQWFMLQLQQGSNALKYRNVTNA